MDAAGATGLLPTLVQRRAAPSAAKGVSLATFAALTVVSALGFLLVLTLIGHYLHLGGL
jgi:hypothetical protein